MSYKGQSLKRFEDPRLVTGAGSYVDDMKLPDMLHAAVLRSPHAHARIRSIDTSAARRLPGVVAVLTGEDIGELGEIPTQAMAGEWEVDEMNAPDQPVLARGKACYVGQTVAVVAAEAPALARDALQQIKVDYEVLKPYIDPLEALEADATPIHDWIGNNVGVRVHHDRQGSDLDAAFSQADNVIKQRYYVQRLAAVPMETRGCVAHYDAQEDFLTVWAATQGAHRYRRMLAILLNRSQDSVRVIAGPDVGGGFGEKGGLYPEDGVVPYLSILLGRPIKWIADRQENMLGYHGRGFVVDEEAAVKKDGTILGIKIDIFADLGAFFRPTPPFRASHRIIGPYKTPTARVNVVGAITNKPPTGAYRGGGGPETAFCMERTVDLIAKELDLDPTDVRRKNFVPPDAFPYTGPTGLTYDSGSYEKVMDQVLEMSDYSGWREKARQRVNSQEPLLGVGIATCVKMSGGSNESKSEKAWIDIDRSGQVTARTGVSPHGQGSDICFAQIIADQVGVTPDDVQVIHGDTAVVESGGGSGATRAMVAGGSAVHVVAGEARDKLSQIASHLLKCPAEDVLLEEGRVSNRKDPEQVITFPEVAAAAYSEELLPPGVGVGLEFAGSYTIPGFHGNPHGFATHVVVVEIDRDTGDVKIIRYYAVNDCGTRINPMIVDGQAHGAIAQGIGQALTEDMIYSPDGQPISGTLLDYVVPSAEGMPSLTMDSYETPSPLNPIGVKGIGELPTVAAPVAVTNAVMDALSHVGVRHIDTPLTPEKIWRALHGHSG